MSGERSLAGGPPEEPAPPRRPSSLLARNPVFAVVALLFCGWLLWDLSPDVAWFFSSLEPVDLGGLIAIAGCRSRLRVSLLPLVKREFADPQPRRHLRHWIAPFGDLRVRLRRAH